MSLSVTLSYCRLIVVILIMTRNCCGNKRHIIVLLHNPVNKRKCLSVYNCVLVRRVIVTAEAEVTQAVRYIFTVVFFNTLQNVRVCSQNKVCTCVNRLVCKLCLCIVRSGSLFFAPVNTYYNKLCTKTFNRTDNIFKFCRLCFVKCVNSDKSDRYSVYISYRSIRTYKIGDTGLIQIFYRVRKTYVTVIGTVVICKVCRLNT